MNMQTLFAYQLSCLAIIQSYNGYKKTSLWPNLTFMAIAESYGYMISNLVLHNWHIYDHRSILRSHDCNLWALQPVSNK